MDKITIKHFQRAKLEGRLCARCGWMITVKNWNNGKRLCWNCEDALRGVNVDNSTGPYIEEIIDYTGEMI